MRNSKSFELFEKEYLDYKDRYEKFETFVNTKKSKLIFKCKCGSEVTINGATSHDVSCNFSYDSKFEFLKQKFKFYDICHCGKEIKYSNELRILRGNINFCSTLCKAVARKFIYKFETKKKNCITCGQQFIGDWETCSEECYSKNLTKLLTEWWKINRNNEKGLLRRKRIGITSSIHRTGQPSWNKDVRGEDFFKHYLKNGINTFYEALKKNFKWYKQTYPEKVMKLLLEKLEINHSYSFFCSHKQFDFLISLKKSVIIIEVDGDYWHRSVLKYKDPKDREKVRKGDKEKEKIIKEKIVDLNKKWYLIRFWENDICKDLDTVSNFLKKLKEKELNNNELENVICEIEKYYEEKS